MGRFHLLKQQLPAVLFEDWWEIILLRMVVSFIKRTITLVNVENQGEGFALFLLVPEDIIITTLFSVCTSEGDIFPFSPGPRHLVLSQLCCHGNHRCRDKSTWMSIRVLGWTKPDVWWVVIGGKLSPKHSELQAALESRSIWSVGEAEERGCHWDQGEPGWPQIGPQRQPTVPWGGVGGLLLSDSSVEPMAWCLCVTWFWARGPMAAQSQDWHVSKCRRGIFQMNVFEPVAEVKYNHISAVDSFLQQQWSWCVCACVWLCLCRGSDELRFSVLAETWICFLHQLHLHRLQTTNISEHHILFPSTDEELSIKTAAWSSPWRRGIGGNGKTLICGERRACLITYCKLKPYWLL